MMEVESKMPSSELKQRHSSKRSSKKNLNKIDKPSKRSSRRRKVSVDLDENQHKKLEKRLSRPNRASRRHLISGDSDLTGINPFQCDDQLRNWEKVKLGFGIILIPIKIVLMLIFVFLGSVLMSATVTGVDISKPLPTSRAKIQRVISAVTGHLLLALFGIYNIKKKGQKAKAVDCKMLVVAPHSTPMDALIVGAVMGAPSGVGKAELSESFVGGFMKAAQTIFVDREDPDNRKNVAQQIQERVADDSPWRRQLLLFPEGTCTNRTSLIQFKKGAFEPGVKVQPIILHWEYENFDPSWTAGSSNRMLIVLRCLSQFYQNVTVEFLPVYEPSTEEQSNSSLYAFNVRKTMAKKLKVPTTEFSTPDMFLAKIAAKRKLKPALALPFTFYSLQKELSAENPDVKAHLSDYTKALLIRFSKAPKMTPEARLSKGQFLAISKKAAQDIKLEEALDWDTHFEKHAHSDGTISFRVFLIDHVKAKFNI